MISSTDKQYQYCLSEYIRWGGILPSTPSMLVRFFEDVSSLNRIDRLKVSTLRVYKAAIKQWHLEHYDNDPTASFKVTKSLQNLSRTERTSGVFPDKSRDLTPSEAMRLIALTCVLNDSPSAKRDRAVAVVAYICGYRAGMICDLKLDWLRDVETDGVDVIIDRPPFKTNKHVKSLIPYTGSVFCPATFIREYIEDLDPGEYLIRRTYKSQELSRGDYPVHRDSINEILKRLLSLSNIYGGKLSARTLRRTMATLSLMNNASILDVASQGGWENTATIENHYVGDAISLLGRAPKALIEGLEGFLQEKSISNLVEINSSM